MGQSCTALFRRMVLATCHGLRTDAANTNLRQEKKSGRKRGKVFDDLEVEGYSPELGEGNL